MWKKPIIAFLVFLIFIAYNNFKDSMEPFSSLKTLILLGDSMLDNELYVGEGNSVFDKIRRTIKNTFNFAEDNATIKDCYAQIERIPKTFNRESSYIILSVGGNDIINNPNVVKSPEKLEKIETDYIQLVEAIKSKFPRANLLVVNIYKPFASYYKMFYEVIDNWNKFLIKSKIYEYEVLDIESLITEKTDLVNDIEPSETGGQKLADLIVSVLK